MNKAIQIFFLSIILISCSKNDLSPVEPAEEESEFITTVDISNYPEIAEYNPIFYDLEGNRNAFLNILKENGVNAIRLRLWVNPSGKYSGFDEVKQFSQTLKAQGFKTWLALHYSDTWADPGQQETPRQWQGGSFESLKDSIYQYTERVVREMQPDYIQIGNEINSGFLHPHGQISSNIQGFKELLNSGTTAVRANASNTKIILHFAGIEGADWFFNQVSGIDYDIIGLSYYPIWHGKSLGNVKTTMQYLSETHRKKIVIAETAYPFTLEWNDWTNNIVGLEEQLILPEYPATTEGQHQFIRQVKELTKEVEGGIGFCYWGAELISWKGNQSTEGSPWENQSIFDFNNKALPVIKAFKIE